MHSTNSYLYTVLERIRSLLDDPDVDAKYTNDYIIRHIICPAQVDVLSRLNNTNAAQIINRFTITIASTSQRYQLPPCVQEVVRLVGVDEDGLPTNDVYPRDRMDYRGKNWSLEGSPGCLTLNYDATTANGAEIELWYVSNGDILPHYGTGILDEDADGVDQLTIDLTPTLGVVDRRPNAYVGQVLRILRPSPGIVEERIIDYHQYSAGDWIVKPSVELTTEPVTGTGDDTVLYEIAPAGSQMLYEAIATWSAIKLGTGRKISQAHQGSLMLQYKSAMKTIGDNLTNMQTRTSTAWVKSTVDNPAALGWGLRPRA